MVDGYCNCKVTCFLFQLFFQFPRVSIPVTDIKIPVSLQDPFASNIMKLGIFCFEYHCNGVYLYNSLHDKHRKAGTIWVFFKCGIEQLGFDMPSMKVRDTAIYGEIIQAKIFERIN